MLTLDCCGTRQHRLLKLLEQQRWDLFLTANYRTVYYLTGRLSPDWPTIFLLWADGASVLIAPGDEPALADRTIALETYSIQRSIDFPWQDAIDLAKPWIEARNVRHGAAERGTTPGMLECLLPEVCDATSAILRLRKRKEPDEIKEIRESLRYVKTAYLTAREAIAPGLSEIDVYNAMYAAVVRQAGTAIPFRGDFACGTRAIRGGGPATARRIEQGDLYILDLFPEVHSYFGDTCRTFAASDPTDLQVKAWELVREAVRIGEHAVRPGVPARKVYFEIKAFLDSHEITENSFWHHAGHGIGIHGHEAPRIIPGSEDLFEIGDVFTLEPGVYTEALQGGIRLEDNYVIREDGLENLFDFPMEL